MPIVEACGLLQQFNQPTAQPNRTLYLTGLGPPNQQTNQPTSPHTVPDSQVVGQARLSPLIHPLHHALLQLHPSSPQASFSPTLPVQLLLLPQVLIYELFAPPV